MGNYNRKLSKPFMAACHLCKKESEVISVNNDYFILSINKNSKPPILAKCDCGSLAFRQVRDISKQDLRKCDCCRKKFNISKQVYGDITLSRYGDGWMDGIKLENICELCINKAVKVIEKLVKGD